MVPAGVRHTLFVWLSAALLLSAAICHAATPQEKATALRALAADLTTHLEPAPSASTTVIRFTWHGGEDNRQGVIRAVRSAAGVWSLEQFTRRVARGAPGVTVEPVHMGPYRVPDGIAARLEGLSRDPELKHQQELFRLPRGVVAKDGSDQLLEITGPELSRVIVHEAGVSGAVSGRIIDLLLQVRQRPR